MYLHTCFKYTIQIQTTKQKKLQSHKPCANQSAELSNQVAFTIQAHGHAQHAASICASDAVSSGRGSSLGEREGGDEITGGCPSGECGAGNEPEPVSGGGGKAGRLNRSRGGGRCLSGEGLCAAMAPEGWTVNSNK
jgi:hypothetical protein